MKTNNVFSDYGKFLEIYQLSESETRPIKES